jgi:Ras-related protein Rab-24
MSKVDLKIVLLGRHSVGKTCLVERFLHGKYKENTVATVGAAFAAKKATVGDRDITLGVWDTAGQERYESMSRIYYRSARCAIVCWDMTEPATFEKVRFWVDELMANEPTCIVFITGTKSDAARDGPELSAAREAAKEYASSVGGQTFETSSKTGDQVHELFTAIAESHFDADQGSTMEAAPTVRVDAPSVEKKGCCG